MLFEAGAFRVLALRDGHYETVSASEVLPEVDLAVIARHAVETEQHAALRAYRDALRVSR